MRIVIAEDNLLTREGLRHLLATAGVDVIGQAEDASALLDLVDETRPDAVVVDIRMPPTQTDEGLRAAAQIGEEHPGTGVLVLSQYVEAEWALRLLRENTGGVGYLLKDHVFDGAVLTDALQRLAAGETVIDSTIISRLMGRRRVADPVAQLSNREKEVLGLVAEGLSNRAIAERLVVTERTVEAHITRTFQKLRISDDPASHKRVLAVLAFLKSQPR